MSTDIACTGWGVTYNFRLEFAGKRGTCTRCKDTFEVAALAQVGVVRRGPPPPSSCNAASTQEAALASCTSPPNEPFEVKQSPLGLNSVVGILPYALLGSYPNKGVTQSLYFVYHQGVMLEQARMTLDRGGCELQAGMPQCLPGAINALQECRSKVSLLANSGHSALIASGCPINC